MYRHLDETRIHETLDRLTKRIGERFPDSGLERVARELTAVADETTANVRFLRRPLWPVRVAAILLVGTLIALLATALVAAWSIVFSGSGGAAQAPGLVVRFGDSLSDLLQGVEALVNDVVFTGIAIWFVLTVETRIKRRRALRAIHVLRSIAHIVDMHQLTKDPERLLSRQSDTASSPVRNMSKEELARYLDYCSELLSVTSKLAALYVQNFADAVVLEAVSEVETLAGGLSAKVWQKITLLDASRDRGSTGLAGVEA